MRAVAVALTALCLAGADAFERSERAAGVADDPDVDHGNGYRVRFAGRAVALAVGDAADHLLIGMSAEVAEAQVVVYVPLRERTGEAARMAW